MQKNPSSEKKLLHKYLFKNLNFDRTVPHSSTFTISKTHPHEIDKQNFNVNGVCSTNRVSLICN